MTETRRTTSEEARRVGDVIGVDWSRFDLEQFRAGMDVEFEHGAHDPQTDVTHDDPIITGKIALAHMRSSPTTTSVSSGWRRRPSGTGQTSSPETTRHAVTSKWEIIATWPRRTKRVEPAGRTGWSSSAVASAGSRPS